MFVHLSPDFLVSNFVGKWIFCTSMRPSTSSMKNYYYLAVLDALCTKLKRHGIGFVVAPRMAPNLLKVKAHSDRIGVATFRGEGDTAVHIVNVYSPHEGYDIAAMDEFYEDLRSVCESFRPNDIFFVAGDFNSKLGRRREFGDFMGNFGRGRRNRKKTE